MDNRVLNDVSHGTKKKTLRELAQVKEENKILKKGPQCSLQKSWIEIPVYSGAQQRTQNCAALVGWSLSSKNDAQRVDALTMAVWRRKPKPGLILHSDQGSTYASGQISVIDPKS